MREIIQIGEWQARELVIRVFGYDISDELLDCKIKILKEFNYIKKSALEEAREYCDITMSESRQYNGICFDDFTTLKNKYEKAIEEIENKRK